MNLESLATKRNKLEIVNRTDWNTDNTHDSNGRNLKLKWERDTHDPPQWTELLIIGAGDTKKSRGIGNGNNYRHFEITVWREYHGNYKEVGKFTHNVYAPALSDGVSSRGEIYKEYGAQSVELWERYFVEAQPQWWYIGEIPRKDWPL